MGRRRAPSGSSFSELRADERALSFLPHRLDRTGGCRFDVRPAARSESPRSRRMATAEIG
jgi:hypothetical protein